MARNATLDKHVSRTRYQGSISLIIAPTSTRTLPCPVTSLLTTLSFVVEAQRVYYISHVPVLEDEVFTDDNRTNVTENGTVPAVQDPSSTGRVNSIWLLLLLVWAMCRR